MAGEPRSLRSRHGGGMAMDAEYFNEAGRRVVHILAQNREAAGLVQGLGQEMRHPQRRRDAVPLEQRAAPTDGIEVIVARMGGDSADRFDEGVFQNEAGFPISSTISMADIFRTGDLEKRQKQYLQIKQK